jgi:hypothetical protein
MAYQAPRRAFLGGAASEEQFGSYHRDYPCITDTAFPTLTEGVQKGSGALGRHLRTQ